MSHPVPGKRSGPSGPNSTERRPTCGVCRNPDAPTTPVTITSGELAVSIPLCETDAAGLMANIDTWLAVAEATATAVAAKGRRLQEGEAVTAIREWAIAQGYPVAKAGSLSQPVIAAYRRAHAKDTG